MIENQKPRPPPTFFRRPRKVGLEETRSVFRPLKWAFVGPSANEVKWGPSVGLEETRCVSRALKWGLAPTKLKVVS